MPTYVVRYSNLRLNYKEKNKIAKEITCSHSKITGANSFFVQVFFCKNKKKDHFIAGKLVKGREIFITGQIRSGRDPKTKKKLIKDLREIIVKIAKVRKDNIWIYLQDLLPEQMIEFGEILPKSGKEISWLNALDKKLQSKLKALDN